MLEVMVDRARSSRSAPISVTRTHCFTSEGGGGGMHQSPARQEVMS